MMKSVLRHLCSFGTNLTSQKLQGLAAFVTASLFGVFNSQAQVATNYGFSQSNGTYEEISADVPTIFGTGIDDALTTITLPFSFPYNGSIYNNLHLSTNGTLIFGEWTGTATGTSTPHTNTAIEGAVVPFGRDLRSIAATANCSAELKTINAEQVYVIQFKDWSIYGQTNSLINFQIQLFESGLIRFIYGSFTNNAAAASTAVVGIRGLATTDYNYRTNSTTVSFTASTVATAATGASGSQAYNFVNATPGVPSSGLTYTWTPSPTACFSTGFITVSEITSSTALINVNTTAVSFDYEVRTSGAAGSGTTGLVTAGNSTTTTFLISGLSPTTTYTVYARANCAGTNSAWSVATRVFTTTCVEFTLPYTHGFNASTLNTCWTSSPLTNTTNYLTYTASTTSPSITPYEGSHFIRYNSSASGSNNHQQLLSTNYINAAGSSDLEVKFAMYQTTINQNNDRVVVVYSIDNGTTWVPVDSVSRYKGDLTVNGWQLQQFLLPAAVDNVPNLKVGLVFKGAAGLNMGVDGFEIHSVDAPTVTSTENFIACASGAIDAQIVINGTDLHRATITIDGVAPTIMSQTRTQIVATVGPGTNGQVILTAPNGTIFLDDFVNIYATPAITTDITTTEVCLNTPVVVNITSNLADYTNFNVSFENEGTITGSAQEGYTISTGTTQNFIITGVREVNGFECNYSHPIVYNAIPGPGINGAFTEITECEGTLLDLSFFEQRNIAHNAGTLGGTATNSTSSPGIFAHTFGGNKTQTIYTATELTQMGWEPNIALNAFSFMANTAPTVAYHGFRVRVGHLASALPLTAFQETGMTVLVDSMTYTVTLGENIITLNAPFYWDGVSGIIIETAWSRDNSGGTSTSVLRETLPSQASYYKGQDGFTAEEVYAITAGTSSNTRMKYTLYAETLIPTNSANIITWTSQQNLYTDNAATILYANENTASMYYRVTDQSDIITINATNQIGCTSVGQYIVNANATIRNNVFQESCNWFIHNGEYLTTSGVYVDSLSSQITGCDSLYILNLTIGNAINNHVSVTSCGAYLFNDANYSTSGNYVGVFNTATGCDSTVHLNLTIVNQLIPQIWYSNDTLYSSANVTNAIYQWENCETGLVIPGAQESWFKPTEHGIYRVRVAEGSCIGNSLCAVYGTAGIEIVDGLDFVVSPNPTTNMVSISYSTEETMQLSIIDATGKVVEETVINSGVKVDLSSFVNGVYIFKIFNENIAKTVRVIKQ